MPSPFDWVFFDLDGTLWDHHAASQRAVQALCTRYNLSPMAFLPTFRATNEFLWRELTAGRTNLHTLRIRRFEIALAQTACHGCASSDAAEMSAFYLRTYLELPFVYAGATEALHAAAALGRVAVLTNGPHDTQDAKLRSLDPAGSAGGELPPPIEWSLCLDDAPALKPSPAFYAEAMRRAGHPSPGRVLMIGDTWADDVEGPCAAGWNAAWISHGSAPGGPFPPRARSFGSLAAVTAWLEGIAAEGRRQDALNSAPQEVRGR